MDPKNKTELLNEIERSHQDMVRFLASLSDEEKTAPILPENWSVKDSLAHLIDWEKMTMDWLTRSLQGEYVRRFIPGFQYETEEQREPVMQALNTHLYEQNKNRALDDVMRDFRGTHRAIADFVGQMNETDIFDPNRFVWRNGSPALDMIGGNTYEHYDEHREWIREALAARAYPTSKQELLKRVRERHAQMEELLASLTMEQMTAPELDDGWSVQDSLAHIVEWENLLLDWTATYRRGEDIVRWAPGFEIEGDNGEEQMNRFNTHLYEKNKSRPLGELLDDFRSTYLRVLELLEGLSESEIFDPDYFPVRKGRPLITLLAGDTYEHYDEHAGWIRAWRAKNN
jgi:hypothetical protein